MLGCVFGWSTGSFSYRFKLLVMEDDLEDDHAGDSGDALTSLVSLRLRVGGD